MDMYQKRKIRKEKRENSNQNEKFHKVVLNWYPGHMAKTKRQIKENISLIDIVYELIDARIPYSSKNKDIDEMIKNKPRILIMTKMDMCDLEETNKWKKYYEDKGYKVVLVDLLNNKNIKEIFNITEHIIKKENIKRKEKGLKERKGRVLVLGIPNAGKSTLINRLVGKKVTNVGNKPGITKSLSWIRVNDKIELLDTPGILWPKLDNEEISLNLASMSAIKEEILDTSVIATHIVSKMQKNYPINLYDRYNLDKEKDILKIFDGIGKKIGAMKNNEIDYDKVYDRIIRDLKEGYLGNVTFDNVK